MKRMTVEILDGTPAEIAKHIKKFGARKLFKSRAMNTIKVVGGLSAILGGLYALGKKEEVREQNEVRDKYVEALLSTGDYTKEEAIKIANKIFEEL